MAEGAHQALAPFAVNHRLVRTSVHRLQADGWLMSRREGRLSAYSLTSDGLRRFMNAYKRVYAPPEKLWDEKLTIVFFPATASAPATSSERTYAATSSGKVSERSRRACSFTPSPTSRRCRTSSARPG
jgi:DNA-binding transcriptional regulator PaaX